MALKPPPKTEIIPRRQYSHDFRNFRKSLGKTQNDFANISGRSSGYIAQVETSAIKPNLELLQTLCDAMGYTYKIGPINTYDFNIEFTKI
jgi:transcriptional regulator with XRE-family HTH domain